MFDQHAAAQCKARWNGIAKPLDSLGTLETLVCQLAGIQHTTEVRLDRRVCLVFCADNGVVEEGVTQASSEVTALQAVNIARGHGSVNAIARAAGCDVVAVDVGIQTDPEEPRLLRRKAGHGTGNIAKGPAMTEDQLERTLKTGIDLAGQMKEQGYHIICTGEMGIGNTTTASAVASVLLDVDPAAVTGRGAGLSNEGLSRKLSAVRQSIRLNSPDRLLPRDILKKLGGFDIAAMTGVFLGGVVHEVPVVIDGVISSVSALLALRINPECRAYMIASHLSREPSAAMVMDALGTSPLIRADMALGEGTGAVALLPLIDLALSVYRQNNTFEHLKMAAYTPQCARKP